MGRLCTIADPQGLWSVAAEDGGCSEHRARATPHERNEQQAAERADGGGSEAVLVRQHVGLDRDRVRQQLGGLRRRKSRIRDVGTQTARIARQPIDRWTASVRDVQPDQVGMHLLTHAHKSLHEGDADLPAEQPADLQQAAYRQRFSRDDAADHQHDERGQRKRLADRLQDLRRQEIAGRPVGGEIACHEAGDPDQHRAERQHRTPVHLSQQGGQGKGDHELRQRDPQQHLSHLQLAEILDRLQVVRDDVAGGKNDEPEAGEHEQQQQQVSAQQQAQIQERTGRPQLAHNERDRQDAAAHEQADNQSAPVPVKPVALIEPGIEHREPQSRIGETGPVELVQQAHIDPLARNAEPDRDEHQRERDAILPVYPFPREVIDVPAFE